MNAFAFFDKASLAGQVTNGPAELMVAGILRTGQWHFGKDTIRIIGSNKPR